jgi:hypothetical protein
MHWFYLFILIGVSEIQAELGRVALRLGERASLHCLLDYIWSNGIDEGIDRFLEF